MQSVHIPDNPPQRWETSAIAKFRNDKRRFPCFCRGRDSPRVNLSIRLAQTFREKYGTGKNYQR